MCGQLVSTPPSGPTTAPGSGGTAAYIDVLCCLPTVGNLVPVRTYVATPAAWGSCLAALAWPFHCPVESIQCALTRKKKASRCNATRHVMCCYSCCCKQQLVSLHWMGHSVHVLSGPPFLQVQRALQLLCEHVLSCGHTGFSSWGIPVLRTRCVSNTNVQPMPYAAYYVTCHTQASIAAAAIELDRPTRYHLCHSAAPGSAKGTSFILTGG